MGEQRLRVLRQTSKRCCTCSNGLPEADTVLVFIGHPPSRIAWTADDTNSFSRIHAGLPKGHDDEPQHERYLPEDGGLRVAKHLVIILRQQYARKAQDYSGEGSEGEPDAQKPWQESRPVHQQRKGTEPKTPKYFVNNKSVKMQIQEQHSQSLPLRLLEYG